MTILKNRIVVWIITFVYAVTLFSGFAYSLGTLSSVAFAENSELKTESFQKDYTRSYYYNNLTITDKFGKTSEYTLAKRFYEVLDYLAVSGDFTDGKISYDLSALLTQEQIKSWVENGNLEIPKAFGAARDSFLLDRPELFYIDLYKIMISAGLQNGKYVAYIDSGDEPNVYRNDSFKNEYVVKDAIAKYNAEIEKIALKAEKNIVNSDAKRDVALSSEVNRILMFDVSYDYDTYDEGVSGNDSLESTAFTAYGALVKKTAVCQGISFAYKAILDYLDVPCIVVSGYSVKEGDSFDNRVGHSWNYVLLETSKKEVITETETAQAVAISDEVNNEWFAFDVTWNIVAKSAKYVAMDYETTVLKHTPYEVISSSNYSLKYPSLSSLNYQKSQDLSQLDEDLIIGDFLCQTKYAPTGDVYSLYTYLSYDGKNAEELLSDDRGLRIAMRYCYSENGEKIVSDWYDLMNLSRYDGSGVLNNSDEHNTFVYSAFDILYSEYMVLEGIVPTKSLSLNQFFTWENVLFEDNDIDYAQTNSKVVSRTSLIENQSYGTYTPAPYINTDKTKPYTGCVHTISDSQAERGNESVMRDECATLITLVYDEPLHIINDSEPIGISCIPEADGAIDYIGYVPFENGEIVRLVADENGVFNTLQFKFKPSLMYRHDRIGYGFYFDNVGSSKLVQKRVDGVVQDEFVTSDKSPNHAYFVWARDSLMCPKIFGDGRLWIECCAQPTLVDNSDLSETNFLDEEGNSTFSLEERSQMMLVVNNVSPDLKNEITNGVVSNEDNNLSANDILASQTYDIKLSICGKYPKIPDGSYVRIALGFPEGYGPDDEGVTFKIFHRKHIEGNEYIIEEIPCVVTKFGIVATVSSFSPFMVAVLPKEKASADKTVYAFVNGKGGNLALEDGKVQIIKENGSYTYTVSPLQGYKLKKVALNGIDVTDKVNENKITLSYNDLSANNELEIRFISIESEERYISSGFESCETGNVIVSLEQKKEFFDFEQSINPDKLDYSQQPSQPSDPQNPITPNDKENIDNNTDKTGLIVGIVVAVVAVAVMVVTIIIIKKRKSIDNGK